MASSDIARSLRGLPIATLLSPDWLRRRILFKLKQDYYPELDISVPLEYGLTCPITDPSHSYSFSEIFIHREYFNELSAIDLPKRWIDIGCHAGYFSLFVAWLRAQRGVKDAPQALLIDADPRVRAAVERLIGTNKFGDSMSFRHGTIAAGTGSRQLYFGDTMSSSTVSHSQQASIAVSVPIITANEILAAVEPPYDLVKIDIEGGEFEFFQSYSSVISNTQHLLLEWHSWHTGGGGKQQIIECAQANGLSAAAEASPEKNVAFNGESATCGTILFSRGNP